MLMKCLCYVYLMMATFHQPTFLIFPNLMKDRVVCPMHLSYLRSLTLTASVVRPEILNYYNKIIIIDMQ